MISIIIYPILMHSLSTVPLKTAVQSNLRYIATGGGSDDVMIVFTLIGMYALAAFISIFVRRARGQRSDEQEGEEAHMETQ